MPETYTAYIPLSRLLLYESATLGNLTLIPDGKLTTKKFPPDDLFDFNPRAETSSYEDKGDRNNLSEAITAITGITLDHIFNKTVAKIDLKLPDLAFIKASRDNDEKTLMTILEETDALLDPLRVDYCRLDIIETEIGKPGYIPEINTLAVYIFDNEIGGGKIIARYPEEGILLPGLGLEIDEVKTSPLQMLAQSNFPEDTVGFRLKNLLRMFGRTFRLSAPEEKLLFIIFGLEGTLTPEDARSEKVKRLVGKLLTQEDEIVFRELYDVRNHFVHRGKRYYNISRNAKQDLAKLQFIIGKILFSCLSRCEEKFDGFWENLNI